MGRSRRGFLRRAGEGDAPGAEGAAQGRDGGRCDPAGARRARTRAPPRRRSAKRRTARRTSSISASLREANGVVSSVRARDRARTLGDASLVRRSGRERGRPPRRCSSSRASASASASPRALPSASREARSQLAERCLAPGRPELPEETVRLEAELQAAVRVDAGEILRRGRGGGRGRRRDPRSVSSEREPSGSLGRRPARGACARASSSSVGKPRAARRSQRVRPLALPGSAAKNASTTASNRARSRARWTTTAATASRTWAWCSRPTARTARATSIAWAVETVKPSRRSAHRSSSRTAHQGLRTRRHAISGGRRRLGEQGAHEGVEPGVLARVVADGDVAHDATLVDDDEGREAPDAVGARRLAVAIDGHAVAHRHALREERDVLFLLGRDTEDAQALRAEPRLQGVELGDDDAARPAPRGPEVEQDDAAPRSSRSRRGSSR